MKHLIAVVTLIPHDDSLESMTDDERMRTVDEVTDYLADKDSPLGRVTINGDVPTFEIHVAVTY